MLTFGGKLSLLPSKQGSHKRVLLPLTDSKEVQQEMLNGALLSLSHSTAQLSSPPKAAARMLCNTGFPQHKLELACRCYRNLLTRICNLNIPGAYFLTSVLQRYFWDRISVIWSQTQLCRGAPDTALGARTPNLVLFLYFVNYDLWKITEKKSPCKPKGSRELQCCTLEVPLSCHGDTALLASQHHSALFPIFPNTPKCSVLWPHYN